MLLVLLLSSAVEVASVDVSGASSKSLDVAWLGVTGSVDAGAVLRLLVMLISGDPVEELLGPEISGAE